MKAYLLGVIAAALLVSVLNTLGGAGQGTRKLVGGLLVALAVFRPLGELELTIPELEQYRRDAQAAVEDGQNQASLARAERISEDCGAYILTKAAELGLQAEVEVTLGTEGLPEAVTIRAAASPAERQELTTALVRELGIEKEAIAWIDPYQSSESTASLEHTNIPS